MRALVLGLVLFGWAPTANSMDVISFGGSGLDGTVGAWRTGWATGASPGRLLLGSSLQYHQQVGLLDADGTNRHMRTHVFVSGSPLLGLELSGGMSLTINSNNAFEPSESLTMGDPFLAIRYGRWVTDEIAVGAKLRVDIPTGAGAFELSPSATSVTLQGLATFILIDHLRIGVDLGYRMDNSSEVFNGDLHAAQLFGGGMRDVDHLHVGAAAAYLFGWSEPFLELYMQVPMKGSGSERVDHSVATRLTLGGRFFPPGYDALSLALGGEIGLSGTSFVDSAWPPMPAFTAFASASWDFGADKAVPATIHEVVHVEKDCPRTDVPAAPGHIFGNVVDDGTGRPVFGARVRVESAHQELSTLLTRSPDGVFQTCRLPDGPTRLVVAMDGYAVQEKVVLVQSGRATEVNVSLRPSGEAAFGAVKGTLRFVGGGKGVANVRIPTRKVEQKVDPASGEFRLRTKTGVFDLLISAKGYVTQRHKIHLHAAEEIILNVELFPSK